MLRATRKERRIAAPLGIVGALALGIHCMAGSACTRQGLTDGAIDTAMSSAHRAPPQVGTTTLPFPAPAPGKALLLLAGDLHTHVSPPDHPSHVSRGLAETIDLAREEGLDFVVLTPHVAARFFADQGERAAVLAQQAALREDLARYPDVKTVFILGFEYTDHRYGHVGVGFADLEKVLAAVPVREARKNPERFFERYVAEGGFLTVNHPLVTPIDSFISIARADLSWRPWTAPGTFPAEIRAVSRLAQGYEAFNLTATHLRDRYLLGDTERTLRGTLARLDQEIVGRRQRLLPVGGSDSHSAHLRATTFVLSESRTQAGIRDALRAGRVCIRSPGACSLEVRAVAGAESSPGAAWHGVGGSVSAPGAVLARATGGEIEIVVNGQTVARPDSGVAASLTLDPTVCSVVRARVDEGFSAPIYVNCPFSTQL